MTITIIENTIKNIEGNEVKLDLTVGKEYQAESLNPFKFNLFDDNGNRVSIPKYMTLEGLETITKETAKVGKKYAFCSGWMEVKSIEKLTPDYMKENDLYCDTRIIATTSFNHELNFGLS